MIHSFPHTLFRVNLKEEILLIQENQNTQNNERMFEINLVKVF